MKAERERYSASACATFVAIRLLCAAEGANSRLDDTPLRAEVVEGSAAEDHVGVNVGNDEPHERGERESRVEARAG